MYNDTIKVANKIITYDDLIDIFTSMYEKLTYYKKVANSEEMQNKLLDYKNQKWTFKDSDSALKFDVDFYDDTEIKFDNYNNFISIFNTRLEEIKSIYVRFYLGYSTKEEGQSSQWNSQYINMFIYESKMDVSVSLSSKSKKIDDVYELIKNKVLNAPVKYDEVVKNKGKIKTSVSLAIGLIPGLVISTLLLIIPTVRQVFASSYVLYPISTMFFSFLIGGMFGSIKLDNLYKNITPEQKYAGYDANKGKSIYKDDIDKYTTTSEILIGKNTNNLKCRKEIMTIYQKYKKYIPVEILILIILSIIVLFLGEI